MILLLDAHALIWWLADDRNLAAGARAAIRDPANDVLVSAATVWELAIKRAKGRISLDADLSTAIEAAGFVNLAVTSVDPDGTVRVSTHKETRAVLL